jgi:glycerol-3-phosphate acyltransferase PlsX
MRVAIDLMGSDSSPEAFFPALKQVLEQTPETVVLCPVAPASVLRELKRGLQGLEYDQGRIHPITAEDVIQMHDSPLVAVRTKRNASLVVGMHALAGGKVDALVSAGNTGALMASATLQLDLLPGVSRPPLLALLPSAVGQVAVVDVGGLVNWRADQLVQFARLGVAFHRIFLGTERPRLGLLNIGSEAMKGNTELRHAYQQLCAHPPICAEFLGNVEGEQVFRGSVDVLVTDGFTGNVFLKAAEGLALFLMDLLREKTRNLEDASVLSALGELHSMTHHAEHPGALVCGVDGVVVKCHGAASEKSIRNGVLGALHYLERGVISQLRSALS